MRSVRPSGRSGRRKGNHEEWGRPRRDASPGVITLSFAWRRAWTRRHNRVRQAAAPAVAFGSRAGRSGQARAAQARRGPGRRVVERRMAGVHGGAGHVDRPRRRALMLLMAALTIVPLLGTLAQIGADAGVRRRHRAGLCTRSPKGRPFTVAALFDGFSERALHAAVHRRADLPRRDGRPVGRRRRACSSASPAARGCSRRSAAIRPRWAWRCSARSGCRAGHRAVRADRGRCDRDGLLVRARAGRAERRGADCRDQKSFRACWINLGATAVYGLIFMGLAVVASIRSCSGWLVLGPVIAGSWYASWRETFDA